MNSRFRAPFTFPNVYFYEKRSHSSSTCPPWQGGKPRPVFTCASVGWPALLVKMNRAPTTEPQVCGMIGGLLICGGVGAACERGGVRLCESVVALCSPAFLLPTGLKNRHPVSSCSLPLPLPHYSLRDWEAGPPRPFSHSDLRAL